LLRGVLDIPPTAVEAKDDGARRVCWRAEASDVLVGEAMLRTKRLERGILQRLHLDLHLIDALSQMEKNRKTLASDVELMVSVYNMDDECAIAAQSAVQ
jgi:hypothetical protein